MARSLRLECPGAVYHVMARGNQGQPIFRDDRDRRVFLEVLAERPKGAPEKVVLAGWLRERTTVSLRWVAERLGMGHYTRVTQAVSRPPTSWLDPFPYVNHVNMPIPASGL